jgi:hypothetical protein
MLIIKEYLTAIKLSPKKLLKWNLTTFESKWGKKYPIVIKSWGGTNGNIYLHILNILKR